MSDHTSGPEAHSVALTCEHPGCARPALSRSSSKNRLCLSHQLVGLLPRVKAASKSIQVTRSLPTQTPLNKPGDAKPAQHARLMPLQAGQQKRQPLSHDLIQPSQTALNAPASLVSPKTELSNLQSPPLQSPAYQSRHTPSPLHLLRKQPALNCNISPHSKLTTPISSQAPAFTGASVIAAGSLKQAANDGRPGSNTIMPFSGSLFTAATRVVRRSSDGNVAASTQSASSSEVGDLNASKGDNTNASNLLRELLAGLEARREQDGKGHELGAALKALQQHAADSVEPQHLQADPSSGTRRQFSRVAATGCYRADASAARQNAGVCLAKLLAPLIASSSAPMAHGALADEGIAALSGKALLGKAASREDLAPSSWDEQVAGRLSLHGPDLRLGQYEDNTAAGRPLKRVRLSPSELDAGAATPDATLVANMSREELASLLSRHNPELQWQPSAAMPSLNKPSGPDLRMLQLALGIASPGNSTQSNRMNPNHTNAHNQQEYAAPVSSAQLVPPPQLQSLLGYLTARPLVNNPSASSLLQRIQAMQSAGTCGKDRQQLDSSPLNRDSGAASSYPAGRGGNNFSFAPPMALPLQSLPKSSSEAVRELPFWATPNTAHATVKQLDIHELIATALKSAHSNQDFQRTTTQPAIQDMDVDSEHHTVSRQDLVGRATPREHPALASSALPGLILGFNTGYNSTYATTSSLSSLGTSMPSTPASAELDSSEQATLQLLLPSGKIVHVRVPATALVADQQNHDDACLERPVSKSPTAGPRSPGTKRRHSPMLDLRAHNFEFQLHPKESTKGHNVSTPDFLDVLLRARENLGQASLPSISQQCDDTGNDRVSDRSLPRISLLGGNDSRLTASAPTLCLAHQDDYNTVTRHSRSANWITETTAKVVPQISLGIGHKEALQGSCRTSPLPALRIELPASAQGHQSASAQLRSHSTEMQPALSLNGVGHHQLSMNSALKLVDETDQEVNSDCDEHCHPTGSARDNCTHHVSRCAVGRVVNQEWPAGIGFRNRNQQRYTSNEGLQGSAVPSIVSDGQDRLSDDHLRHQRSSTTTSKLDRQLAVASAGSKDWHLDEVCQQGQSMQLGQAARSSKEASNHAGTALELPAHNKDNNGDDTPRTGKLHPVKKTAHLRSATTAASSHRPIQAQAASSLVSDDSGLFESPWCIPKSMELTLPVDGNEDMNSISSTLTPEQQEQLLNAWRCMTAAQDDNLRCAASLRSSPTVVKAPSMVSSVFTKGFLGSCSSTCTKLLVAPAKAQLNLRQSSTVTAPVPGAPMSLFPQGYESEVELPVSDPKPSSPQRL